VSSGPSTTRKTAAGDLFVDLAQLHGHDPQRLVLEARDDLADEAPLDGVRLADDEGAVAHDGRTLAITYFLA